MISNRTYVPLLLATALASAACAPPGGDGSAKSAAADAPTADALLALERQAHEAYMNGDGAFFEGLLNDKFVMRAGGAQLGKAGVVKMISGVRCEVNEGWSLTEPKMLRLDDDTYVLSYKTTMEGNCTANGMTETVPSPVRAATVWVRSGDAWQAAFHGENQIVDPTAPQAPNQQGEPTTGTAGADVHPAANPAVHPITDALMAAERAIWEAWRTHDAKRIEDQTAKDIAFVNIFGTSFPNKVATVKDWTSAACDVESFALTDGAATAVSPTVGILTLKGTAQGTCSGQDISGQEIYGTTVYVKEGDAWKWAFGFNSPT